MAGSAGFASACAAGLGASVPQPPKRMLTGAKLKNKGSRILPARTVPEPTILSWKDGAYRVPLAQEPSFDFDKVFAILTLGSRPGRRITLPLSPECGGLATPAALPDAPNRASI